MAAVNPARIQTGIPIVVERQTIVGSTPVSDGDTLTFGEFTSLTQAKCHFELVADGADVAFTTTTNVVTIGVHVPPLASENIRGYVIGL